MKYNAFANVAQKESSIGNNKNQLDKYRTLIEKLQLGPNNWPKFHEQLKKKLHKAEICQLETQTQIKQKEFTTNVHMTAIKISIEKF